MKLGKMVLILIAVVTAFAVLSYVYSGVIIIRYFAKANNLDISYKTLKSTGFDRFIFKDFVAIEKRTGIGVSAAYASIISSGGTIFSKDPSLNIDLRDVSFIARQQKADAYDSLTGLVSMPFNGKLKYKEIKGIVQSTKEGVSVKDLTAISDEMKLSFTGSWHANDTINFDIIIYFCANLAKKIPEELSKILLRDEADGWKSLSVRLAGDYNAPSIQISSKLFRLNIGVKQDK